MSVVKPLSNINWANTAAPADVVYPSVIEPSGYAQDEPLPHEEFNGILKRISDWTQWLDDIFDASGRLTLGSSATLDMTSGTTTLTTTSLDITSTATTIGGLAVTLGSGGITVVDVNGDLTVDQNATVSGNTSLNGSLDVTGAAAFDGTLTANTQVICNANLTVVGNTFANSDLAVGGSASADEFVGTLLGTARVSNYLTAGKPGLVGNTIPKAAGTFSIATDGSGAFASAGTVIKYNLSFITSTIGNASTSDAYRLFRFEFDDEPVAGYEPVGLHYTLHRLPVDFGLPSTDPDPVLQGLVFDNLGTSTVDIAAHRTGTTAGWLVAGALGRPNTTYFLSIIVY